MSCFGPIEAGRFSSISKVGCFDLILGVGRFGSITWGKTGKLLGWVHPDFALIKVIKINRVSQSAIKTYQKLLNI